MDDEHYMRLALIEAKKGKFSTSPNPRVGCVLVKDNHPLSSGYHEVAGGPHAEIVAINNLQANPEGVTAYVTLEPCSHYGRTPPCCQALVALGLSSVVVAMRDPNPLVAGRGLEAIQQAGIEVRVGACEQEALYLNRGYVKRMLGRGPWLTGKVAMSVDGRMALANGESKWLTGELARRDVMNLRAESCAILTGIQTIVADDPLLNIRMLDYQGALKQPDLLILDSKFCLSADAKVLTTVQERRIRVLTLEQHVDAHKQRALAQLGCEVHLLPEKNGRVCLRGLRHWLAGTQYNQVMVESGPTLMSALLDEALLDDLIVYQAPMFLGAQALAMDWAQLASLQDALRFQIGAYEKVGEDLKIQYLFNECRALGANV